MAFAKLVYLVEIIAQYLRWAKSTCFMKGFGPFNAVGRLARLVKTYLRVFEAMFIPDYHTC
jgi:hypothetical protein